MRHGSVLSLMTLSAALALGTLTPPPAAAHPVMVEFETLDTDADGAISRAEFEAIAAAHSTRMQDRQNRSFAPQQGRRFGARGDEGMRERMRERMPEWARERAAEAMRGSERMLGRFGSGPAMGMMGMMGAVAPQALAEALVRRFDTDGDARLDAEELAAGMQAMREEPSARLGVMFAILDTDGDGMISEEEFEAAYERMRERMGRPGRAGPGWRAPESEDAPAAD